MPYVHCDKCQHEWECATNSKIDRKCDWCGGGSYILEDEPPLAKMLNTFDIIELLEKMKHPESKAIAKKLKKHGIKK
jgi:hypothetical protein